MPADPHFMCMPCHESRKNVRTVAHLLQSVVKTDTVKRSEVRGGRLRTKSSLQPFIRKEMLIQGG